MQSNDLTQFSHINKMVSALGSSWVVGALDVKFKAGELYVHQQQSQFVHRLTLSSNPTTILRNTQDSFNRRLTNEITSTSSSTT